MTDDPIKAALVAAEDAALREAWRNRRHTDEAPIADMREANRWGAWNDAIKGAPAAVAAFLRALPDWHVMQEFRQPPVPGTTGSGNISNIAAAVERAAQEARDGE